MLCNTSAKWIGSFLQLHLPSSGLFPFIQNGTELHRTAMQIASATTRDFKGLSKTAT